MKENSFRERQVCSDRYSKANIINMKRDYPLAYYSWENMCKKKKYPHVLFTGLPGRGKTFCLTSIFRDACEKIKRNDIAFINESEFFTGLKGQFKDCTATSYEKHFCNLTNLGTKKLILFDDFGSRLKLYESAWAQDQIFDLIEIITVARIPCFFSTNLGSRAIRELVGERCDSRLNYFTTVNFDDKEDQRKHPS